jgi:hypothetical protein
MPVNQLFVKAQSKPPPSVRPTRVPSPPIEIPVVGIDVSLARFTAPLDAAETNLSSIAPTYPRRSYPRGRLPLISEFQLR